MALMSLHFLSEIKKNLLLLLQGHRRCHFHDKCQTGWYYGQYCDCSVTRFVLSSANIHCRSSAGRWRIDVFDAAEYNANSTFVTIILHHKIRSNQTKKNKQIQSNAHTKRNEANSCSCDDIIHFLYD